MLGAITKVQIFVIDGLPLPLVSILFAAVLFDLGNTELGGEGEGSKCMSSSDVIGEITRTQRSKNLAWTYAFFVPCFP